MTTPELLSQLNELNILVRADNGQLVVTGPKGVLTPALRAQLSERKAEIVKFLGNRASSGRQKEPRLQPASRNGNLPLSFAQQRLWFLDQYAPDKPFYNNPLGLRLSGPLDVAALDQSLNEIIRRHEVLRTTFSMLGGEPVQIIAAPVNRSLPVVDLSDRCVSEREEEAQRLVTEETRRPFDLTRGPLFRNTLLRLAEDDHVLLLTLHHIVSDGWSMGVLYRELSVLYEAFSRSQSSPLPELAIQYADYAVWQRQWLTGELLETQLSHWTRQLEEAPAMLNLPTDRPRPAVQTYRGAWRSIELSKELTDGLKALSRKEGATLFMTLLAAFQTLLSRYTGQEDIVVGSPIANRSRTEIENLIGFFVNTLVLRADLSGNPIFSELLQRVRKTALEAYEHQDLPFEKLVEELNPERNLNHSPLFQVMFALQNAPASRRELSSVVLNPLKLESNTTKFDLSLSMIDRSDGLKGTWEYSTDLFDEATIVRINEHFQRLLEGIVVNPNQSVWDLPILTEPEKHELLIELNDTKREHPRDKCLNPWFEEQVDKTPDGVAVVFEDQQLTYRELNRRANQVAHHLRELGVGPEVLVGICVERSLEMVVGLLGVLKAGGAYVPLDPSFPKERLGFILEDARVSVLVTQERLSGELPEFHGPTIYLDTGWDPASKESGENPVRTVNSENLAYVIFTSGSTGRPKGVAVEHRQLVNYLSGILERMELSPNASFATVSTIAADLGNTIIFSSLCSGGTLHVISEDRVADANAMAEYMSGHAIDCLKIVPSHLAALLSASQPERVLPRQLLILGGEACTSNWLKRIRALAPQCTVLNHYGPTEATIGVLTYRVGSDGGDAEWLRLPLGRPLANTEIYVLDRNLNPVPVGVPGELHIGGLGLARGYLHRPELTAEKFFPNPFSVEPGARLYRTGDLARYLANGNVEFLRRIDDQVKIRGYRIEPAEIETVLREHPDVRDAVVIAREEVTEEQREVDNPKLAKRLVAYVVADQRRAATVAGRKRYPLPNGAAVAHLNKNETDYIYEEIFERQAYLRHGITIKDGDCIFDVGANIGLFTVFANQIAKDPQLYCFEPNPSVFENLRANAALYGSEVKLFNCGLSDQAKTAEFTFFPGFSLLSGFYADAQKEREVVKTFMINQGKAGVSEMAELVEQADAILAERFAPQCFSTELKTLSSVIEQEDIECIDLLKINVEKSELDVLNGIKNADWEKIQQIVLEVDVKESLPAIVSLLDSHGFEFVVDQDLLLAGTPLCYVYAVRPSKDRALVREQRDETHIRSLPVLDQTLLSTGEIKEFLGRRLPEPMVPSAYVFLDSLPLTANGKIDKRALPEPDTVRPELEDCYVAPRNSTEELVAQIWSDVLQVEKIGIHDNFFDLGGHSLLATQVISRIRDAFRIELPLRSLFEAPTSAGLAEHIVSAREGKAATTALAILPEVLDGGYPLSFSQERFWFLTQLEPDNLAYSVAYGFRITGPLNTEALERSLAEIVRRHETLRTTIHFKEGRPVQVISERWSFRLIHFDLSEEPAVDLDTKVQRLFENERRRSFDLSTDLLLRSALLRLKTNEHVLLLNSHHIAWDHWCIELFFHELAALYRAYSTGKPSPLSDLPVQYKHYALRQRKVFQGAELEERLAYWKQQLSGAPPSLNLLCDHPRRHLENRRGGGQSVLLSNSLSEELRAIGRQAGVTLFMTFVAAFQTLLHRMTGQDDIVVGTPVAGRDRSETEGLIGLFLNSLALRTDLSGNPTFLELLTRVREVALGAYDHQDLPFEKLVEELQPERNLTQTPVFQVFINMYNFKETGLELDQLAVEPIKTSNLVPQFDIEFYIREHEDGVHLTFGYDTDLFDAATIARMLDHFQVLLQQVVANPEQRISDLPIFTDAEELQLLVAWNDTKRDYPEDKCLHQLFEEQAASNPDGIAVVFEDQQLSYGELNRRANQLAHHLQKLGVGPDVLVGICVERSLEMVVGLLGVLKSGGAYVPLDPGYPKERLALMLEDSRTPVLLTQQRLVDVLPEHGARVIFLDADWDAIVQESRENPLSPVKSQNLAYVIYTSGSTGRAKGVQILHHAAVNFLSSMREQPGLTRDDILLSVTTLSFDIAALEIFLPMIVGARVILISRETAADGVQLLARLSGCKATVMQATPATWRLLLEAGWQGSKPLKILCGGEALPRELAHQLLQRCSSLWNMYGPTETTIWSAIYQVQSGDGPVPIGRPIANTRFYILDSRLHPVPIGVPGELHIGGAGLARGYLNRPELNAEKFIVDPFTNGMQARLYKTGDLVRYLPDGHVEFLGRNDHQVKIRGFRIELGEIETVLGQHPAVKESVVIARQDKAGEKYLAAYLIAGQEPVPSVEKLRSFLKQQLPEYMVPSVLVFLDSLPLTPNGKVDRKALPAPDRNRSELEASYVAPRDAIEVQLTRIWEKVLGHGPIGGRDNFFELGGHSLLAVQVIHQIREVFGQTLPVKALFQGPTVEQLAEVLQEEDALRDWASLVPLQPHGSKPPFFFLAGRSHFGDRLGPDQPVYRVVYQDLDREQPFVRIEDMAFHSIESVRKIQPDGPYYLGGHATGGMVAFEMAQQLRRQGQKVALLALCECWAPQSRRTTPSTLSAYRFWKKVNYHFHRTRRVGTRQEFTDLLVSLKNKTREAAKRRRSVPLTQAEEDARAAVFEAKGQYVPQVYSGRITLVRCSERRAWRDYDTLDGWGSLAKDGVEVYEVPGSHSGIYREPNVGMLAKTLSDVLHEAQAGIESEQTALVEANVPLVDSRSFVEPQGSRTDGKNHRHDSQSISESFGGDS